MRLRPQLEQYDDVFLRFEYQFKSSTEPINALAPLYLNRAPNAGRMRARLALLAEAKRYSAFPIEIAYPRNRNAFVGMQRYNGRAYNYRNVVAEVDRLTEKGLLFHTLQPPMSNREPNPRQSTFRATPKLVDLLGHLELVFVQHEVIRLREMFDKATGKVAYKKDPWREYGTRLIDYKETDYIREKREEVLKINEFMAKFSLQWPGMNGRLIGKYHEFDNDGQLITPLYLTRSFSRGSVYLYGRCHGFWQNAPKDMRKFIRLNGEETCEPDYSQYHLNICYLEMGIIPPDDAYSIDGFSRQEIKTAVPVILNASSEAEARGALAGKFDISAEHAADIIQAVKTRHSDIDSFFHQDQGVKLMKIDSDIAVRVMLNLIQEGIPFLPVHDSFRVPISGEKRVKDIMISTFSSFYPAYICYVK